MGGVEIDYLVPNQLQRQTVTVWINGKVVSERTYEQETDDQIIIPLEQLPSPAKNAFEIEITCSDSFAPSLIEESVDNRELALCIRYVGGVQ